MPTLEQHKQAYARAMAAGDTLAAYKIKNIIEDEQEAKTKAAQQSVQGLDTDITPQPESTLLERAGEVIERRGAGIEET